MMARVVAGVSFSIALVFLGIGGLLYLAKDWFDAAMICVSACPWLLCGIAGVLISSHQVQRKQAQADADERKRQHIELMAALKKSNEQLTILAILAEGRRKNGT